MSEANETAAQATQPQRPRTLPTPPNKSWKTEVEVSGTWGTNGVRFATKEEAEAAGNELLGRWFVPTASRAAESEDEVNYRFNFDSYRPERIGDL